MTSGNSSTTTAEKTTGGMPLPPIPAQHTGHWSLPSYEHAVNGELARFGDPKAQINLQPFDKNQEPLKPALSKKRRNLIIGGIGLFVIAVLVAVIVAMVLTRKHKKVNHPPSSTLIATKTVQTSLITARSTSGLQNPSTQTLTATVTQQSITTITPTYMTSMPKLTTVVTQVSPIAVLPMVSTCLLSLGPDAPATACGNSQNGDVWTHMTLNTLWTTITMTPTTAIYSPTTFAFSPEPTISTASSLAPKSDTSASAPPPPSTSISTEKSTVTETTSRLESTTTTNSPATTLGTPLIVTLSTLKSLPPVTKTLPPNTVLSTITSTPTLESNIEPTTTSTSVMSTASGWINFCGVPGQSCNGRREVDDGVLA